MGHAGKKVGAAIALLALVMAAPARAQSVCPPDHVGCASSDVEFHHRDALFDGVMLDSGWVPASSPIQVRFAILLGGSTEVDMAGTATTWWPSSLSVAVPGRPGSGRFAIDYGLEILARARVDVEVGGIRYREEIDIPMPGGIPRDLRVAAETLFDPFVLPGADPRPITAWDDTDRVRVVEIDVTDSLIPIPGVGGGFAFDAVASLEGSYRTDRIAITDALTDITEERASVVVRADPGAVELGAAKDYTVLPHGTITYDGVVTFYPTFFIEVPGRRWDLTIAEIPLHVVDLSAATDFEPADVHVPLPDVRLEETSLAFGELYVGGGFEQLLTVYNDGEAELHVRPANPDGPFVTSSLALVIPPSSSARLAVRFEPMAAGQQDSVLRLDTNDPDEPRLAVRLSGYGHAAASTDAGIVDIEDAGTGMVVTAGGCGCRTSGARESGPWAALIPLVGLLALRRRRR